MKEVTNQFPQDTLRVSVVEFGRVARVISPLTTPASARNAIDRMQFAGSISNLTSGLQTVVDSVLGASNNRDNAYDVVMILTDGVANVDVNTVVPYTNVIRTMGPTGAKISTVAIGGAPNRAANSRFKDVGIVDEVSELLFMRDYISLNSDVASASRLICSYLVACTTPSGCPGISSPPPGKETRARAQACVCEVKISPSRGTSLKWIYVKESCLSS